MCQRGNRIRCMLNNANRPRLSNNQLTDISALAEIISLQRLNLSNNEISDTTSLEQLGNIETINVSGNPLNCSMFEKLVLALGKDTVIGDACAAASRETAENN